MSDIEKKLTDDYRAIVIQKSDADEVLHRIHALGAVLANQDWDTPMEGKDLQYFGFVIRDLATAARKKLYPDTKSEIPDPTALAGE